MPQSQSAVIIRVPPFQGRNQCQQPLACTHGPPPQQQQQRPSTGLLLQQHLPCQPLKQKELHLFVQWKHLQMSIPCPGTTQKKNSTPQVLFFSIGKNPTGTDAELRERKNHGTFPITRYQQPPRFSSYNFAFRARQRRESTSIHINNNHGRRPFPFARREKAHNLVFSLPNCQSCSPYPKL